MRRGPIRKIVIPGLVREREGKSNTTGLMPPRPGVIALQLKRYRKVLAAIRRNEAKAWRAIGAIRDLRKQADYYEKRLGVSDGEAARLIRAEERAKAPPLVADEDDYL